MAAGWVVAFVTIMVKVEPVPELSQSQACLGMVLLVVVGVLAVGSVGVRSGTVMRVTNYWDDEDESWESSPAAVTRTTILSLQSTIEDRRSELRSKGKWARWTQIASVATILTLVALLLLGG